MILFATKVSFINQFTDYTEVINKKKLGVKYIYFTPNSKVYFILN